MSISLHSIELSPSQKKSPSKSSSHPESFQTLNTSRTQKTLTPQYLQKKFEDLYLENQRWTAKKQKLREEKMMSKQEDELKECTFQPVINPEASYNGSNPSPFLKREMDWLHKKEKKIEELSRQTEKKLKKECSFKPKISSKTYAILSQSHKIQKSRNFYDEQTQSPQYRQKKAGCYRQIHMKQEGYKELQKANSVHHFMLMTERRFASKMGHLEEESQRDEYFNSQNKRMGSLTSRPNFKFTGEEDYIENIVIKTEEQNTFDSATEMELKPIKQKQENEIEMLKCEVEKKNDDNYETEKSEKLNDEKLNQQQHQEEQKVKTEQRQDQSD